MFQFSQAHVVDGYKLGHISQYIKGTQFVGSNMTPRSDALARYIEENYDGKMFYVGLQLALINMVESWDATFFKKSEKNAIKAYKRRVKNYLGPDHGDDQIEAMRKLHQLGYLPIEVKSLPEGVKVPMQVPVFTVKNTHEDFYWLTNYLETYLSCMVWTMCNAASISEQYLKTSKRWAKVTNAPDMWIGIANHCFAGRGHRGDWDSMISGMGHMMVGNLGTDTLWAIDGMEHFYGADSDKEMIGVSVNAFEHATATQRIAYYRDVLGYNDYSLQAEEGSLKDILTELYPTGIISYVSDSEDHFGMLEKVLPKLKDVILARTADSWGLCKTVFRPDSSPKTPLEIIVGDHFIVNSADKLHHFTAIDMHDKRQEWVRDLDTGNFFSLDYSTLKFTKVPYAEVPAEIKGSLQLLWDTFEGTTNDLGFRVINEKVGLIYGEAIDIEMQDRIFDEMVKRGWCVSNVLLGTGSWGFLKDSSRDSFNIAIKGTNSVVNGQEISMQKNPKTAAGAKKSAKGMLRVELEDGEYILYDQQTAEQELTGELKTVLMNGDMYNLTTLSEIRGRCQ